MYNYSNRASGRAVRCEMCDLVLSGSPCGFGCQRPHASVHLFAERRCLSGHWWSASGAETLFNRRIKYSSDLKPILYCKQSFDCFKHTNIRSEKTRLNTGVEHFCGV